MISQRVARQLKKRVAQLESILRTQRNRWAAEYPGGTLIAQWKQDPTDVVPLTVSTARRLGHAVVVTISEDGNVKFIALPHPAETV